MPLQLPRPARWFARLRGSLRGLSLERRTVVALVVATLALIVVLGITYASALRLLDVASETRRSEGLLGDLRLLQAYAYDVETGSRGYVISGDDRQLAPYYSGRELLETLKESLRARVGGDGHMGSLYNDLEPLLDGRLEFAARLVETRREQGFEPARTLLLTNEGQDLTDAIRAHLDEMQAYAGLQLEEDRRAVEQDGRRVFYFSAVATFVTVALFAAVYIAVRKELATRRRTEAALRQSRAELDEVRARLTGIIDSAHDAIVAMDEAGIVVMFNRGAENMLGIPAQEIIGKPALSLVPERFRADFGDRARNPVRLAARGEQPLPGNARLLRADGTELAAEPRVSTVEVGGKKLYTIILRDVTERNAAEEALRQSEASYRAVVEGSSDVIFAYDIEPGGVPRLSFVNDTVEAVYGIAPEAMLGRTPAENFPADVAAILNERIAEAIAAGRPVDSERSFTRAGEERTVSAHLTPIFDRDGRCYRVIGNSRDITEVRRVRQMEEEARHARSLGVLASGIAHDFNNALTSIMGNAGLAAILAGESSPAREPMLEIESAARRASDLVAQLLSYSGQSEPRLEMVDICALVDSVAGDLRSRTEAPIRWTHDCRPGLAPVEADPAQLRQAISNIMVNAIEALGPAGGSIGTTAGVRLADRAYLAGAHGAHDIPEGEYVYIDVKDTGPGMDPGTRGHVFDPFFTTKFAGRGLGLPTALGIVRSHGGALRIDSVPGHGTLVALLFPPTRPASASSTAAGPPVR